MSFGTMLKMESRYVQRNDLSSADIWPFIKYTPLLLLAPIYYLFVYKHCY